jgi:hypothetical protein
MEHLIAWAGFLGAWLLVAGPVYQAALELQEEEVDREAFGQVKDTISKPEPMSGWWWLLPPVAFLKQQRLSNDYREAVVGAMPGTVIRQFVHFQDKAMGWLLVAAGAFFIAVKETWELHDLQEWDGFVFWLLLVVMLLLTLGYTAYRMRRSAVFTSGAETQED